MRAKPLVAGAGAAIAAVFISTVVLRAQAGGQGAAPPPRLVLPTAASSVALRPDAHFGERVSMVCVVEAVLSKTVFTVDQHKDSSTDKDVLVISPYLNTAVAPNAPLTVLGEVFKFDPIEATKRAPAGYVLELSPELAAKYQGRPAVFATSVITAELVDIGRRLPPPLSPADIALRDAMIAINTNNGGLRTGLATPDAARIKDQIAALKTAFGTAGTFFSSKNAADAVGWSADALKFIATMETAAAASRWDDVRTAATGLGGLCAPCHAARRERFDDGSYRFKG